MKILCSLSLYFPYVSGLSVVAKRLAEKLAGDGNRVSVLCMKHDTGLPNTEMVNRVEVTRAIPIIKIGKGFLSFDFVRKAISLVTGCDRVIVHLPQFEGWIIAVLSILFRKDMVAVYHCDVVLKNKIIQVVLDISSLFVLFWSRNIVVTSIDYAKSSRILPLFKSKWVEIYPPIPNSPAKKRQHKNKDAIVLGMVTRMAAEKGIEYLMGAIPIIEKMNNLKVELCLAGPEASIGESGYRKKIFDQMTKINSKIKILGYLTDNQLKNFYEIIDIFVLPSVNKTEAFGMVQVEAMFAGVPVVASDLPGVRLPVVMTKMGRLAIPRDPVSLATEISEVYDHWDKYHSKINEAVNIFDVSKVYEKYKSVILS